MSASSLTYEPNADVSNGAISIDTASVAPTSGRLLVVVVSSASADFADITPDLHKVTGLSGTWTSQVTVVNTYRRLSVFTSPNWSGSGVLTLTTVNGTRNMFNWAWEVFEWTESIDAAIINQAASSNVATGTAVNAGTLGALGGATNPILFAESAMGDGATTMTGDAGWSDIGNTNGRFHTFYGYNDTTATGTLAVSKDYIALALEFKLAAAGASTATTWLWKG